MGSRMTRKEAKGQPTPVDILWRGRNKTTHIVAPEREAAESEAQATAKIAQQSDIVCRGIATPMEGVTLGTSPGRARPDDALARMRAFYHFPEGFVVTQRIEVMLIKSTLAAVIEAVIGRRLAKVTLDGRDTLLHQTLNLRLIPVYCLRIREVEDGILHRHAARGVHHVQAFLDDLREETVLGCEIRQLPQTGVEAVLRELFQHADGILEAFLGKFIVALPVDAEPPCIEMDHVGRDPMRTQLTGYLQALFLGEIGDTAHPGAKAPEGQHGRLARNIRIFIKDILRLTEEDEEVHLFVAHEQTLGSDIRRTEVAGHRG